MAHFPRLPFYDPNHSKTHVSEKIGSMLTRSEAKSLAPAILVSIPRVAPEKGNSNASSAQREVAANRPLSDNILRKNNGLAAINATKGAAKRTFFDESTTRRSGNPLAQAG
jgi:hypothetical protein